MQYHYLSQLPDNDPSETSEWLEAFQDIVDNNGPGRARYIVSALVGRARALKLPLPGEIQTPYINTIPTHEQAEFPGDRGMEKRIRRIIRWNAMAMVTRANSNYSGLGGHISTYASS